MKIVPIVAALCFFCSATSGQSAPPAPGHPVSPSIEKKASPQPITDQYQAFMKTADTVLMQMSQILDLPIKAPLKESLRSKQDIRAYIVRTENEDSTPAERYADDRTLEAFGLIPKGFPLDSFLLNSLTDQVAGLYDPKAKEFYIADWIPPAEQTSVMAHELTHALEDQSFDVDPWIKAARPNLDAEIARQAVSEGTALSAMIDYSMLGQKLSVRQMPDVSILLKASMGDDSKTDPAKEPPYIEDSLMFPYLAGSEFTQQFLKAHTGWSDLKLIFKNPPVSTQQILHPDLYAQGVLPEDVVLPAWAGLLPSSWTFLEENVMGEFFFDEILKQYLGQQLAIQLSPAWRGDRYATFEDKTTKNTLLVFRVSFDTVEDTARFCGQYSEALELKYKNRADLFRRPNFFQFETGTGGVFLRCVGTTGLVVEGADRATFDKIDAAIGWPAAPSPMPEGLSQPPAETAANFGPSWTPPQHVVPQ